MRPSGFKEDRDCVYHYYGKLPECKNYNFLPADKPPLAIKKSPVIIDFYQYKGRIK